MTLWLPMTERAGGFVRDGSGFGALGTLTTGATWAAGGPTGSCVNCPATGTISIPSTAFTMPLGPATISVWYNPTNFTNYTGIASKTTSNNPNPIDWYLGSGTGQPVVYFGNGSAVGLAYAVSSPIVGKWNFLVVAIAGNNLASMVYHYLNGLPNGFLALSGSAGSVTGNNALPLIIGNRADGVTQANGKYSDARVYQRVLTPSEVMTLYLDGLRPWRAKPRPVVPKPAAVAAGYRARVVRWG
jgi:hypothetical protein